MNPLTSPVREHRFVGRAEMAIGMLFIIVAAALNPADAIVGLFVVTPVLASLLYLAAFRRVARQAVANPGPAPTAEREDGRALRRRVTGPLAAQAVVYLLLTATARTPGLLGGIALGIGIALVLTARWLERWENAHETGLLREPRARGRAAGYYVAVGRKTTGMPDANEP
jgi:hypothetical protein